MEKLYTVKEIAEALSLNKMTVQRFIKEKKIKAVKVGREYRVKESDYNEFIKG